MLVGRVIGSLLLLAAAWLLGADVVAWHRTGSFAPVALGQLWFAIDSQSLLLAQPAIQRHVAAWLWDPVIEDVLRCWAFAAAAVLGLALLWFCRRRRAEPGRLRRRRAR